MKIAWIGTGVMGRPMALNLHNGGYNVHVYNRTSKKAYAMEEFGVKAHDSINSVISDADVIFTIVGFPSDVRNVYDQIFSHAKKGAIVVDMTTSSPTLAKSLYQEGIVKGLELLDAPVTGGDTGAINASLSIMVGGNKDAFDKVYPLLLKMGKTINYMGDAGNGQFAKLANQAAIAGAISGIAEALSFAKVNGLNLETMLNVITGGSATSWQAANNGPKMISNDNNPGFYIKHFLKDLKLIIDESTNFSPEVVKAVIKIYEKLVNDGHEDLGTQAIIKYYDK